MGVIVRKKGRPFRSSPAAYFGFLLAVDGEIVERHSRGAISIDREVHRLVHQEVVPWTLPDNPSCSRR